MSTQTNTVKREPRSKHYTPETKQLFIRAEELAQDVGKTALQLWSGDSRKQPLTTVRHCIMYILWQEYLWNYAEIGRALNRDHATAIYAIRRMKELLEINDPQVTRYIHRLSRFNGTNTKAKETEQILCSCERARRKKV
jgi:chromosomal replication initiation ATPase DnaA